MKTVFTASKLYTPTEEIQRPLLVVEDGRITELSSLAGKPSPAGPVTDFGDAVLAPGYVDIHIHGGAGIDLMRAPAADLPRLGKFLSTHGVTGYFPTTVAASMDSICSALERLADAIEAMADVAAGARPLGIH